MSDTITIEQMRDSLKTLDETKKELGKTEPLYQVGFPLEGKKTEVARFELGGWNEGDGRIETVPGIDPVEAYVTIDGKAYQLTKDALLEATSFIGITKQYTMRTPTRFIEPELNYWFAHNGAAHGQKTFKALVMKDRVIGFAKEKIVPFSNLALLGEVEAGVRRRFGKKTEMLVDYKFHHTLRRTATRIIIPSITHDVRGEGDTWSLGVQLKNSAVGEQKTPLALTRYFFRWWCTNGSIHTSNESQKVFNRRMDGGSDEEAVAWAKSSIDELLDRYEPEFKKLDHFAKARLPRGMDANHALLDVFDTYRVPVEQRADIISEFERAQDFTMYGAMNAITRIANDMRLPDTIRETLMRIGGDLPEAHSHRCDSCHRILN
jgi:hypothetical protein